MITERRVTTCLGIDAFSLQSHRHSHGGGQLQGDRGQLLLGSVGRVKGERTLDCDRMLVNFCIALLQQSI